MIGIASVVLLAATLVGIWVLTEQSAEETSALSGSVAEAIGAGAAGAGSVDGAGGAGGANATGSMGVAGDGGAAAGSGSAAGATQDPAEPSVFSQLTGNVATWASLNVRRLAHTAEFAVVGFFASFAAECLGEQWARGRGRAIAVVAFCALCSLADQTHKLFVPGRHFDAVDLGFDAAGYLVACALVFAVTRVVRAMKRSRGLSQGLEEG